MSASHIADVILYTRHQELAKIAGEHLKMKGVSSILTAATADDCIDRLERFNKAMLVIDWDLGAQDVARVLGHNRREAQGSMRPILLVASKMSEQVVATAAEYGVSQIFTEEVNKKNLGSRLTNMLLGETLADDIKKAIGKVQKARSEGDPKKGSQILLNLLPKHPNNLRLKCEVAEVMMELNQVEGALKTLEGMDKTKPPYLRGLHLYGRCMMKLGRFDEALLALQQASLFNPHDVDRLVDIGQAMLQMDRVKDASAEFDKALSSEPANHAANIGRAQCKLMDSQVNDALMLLKDVASDLEMASVFNTCAVINMRQKRHQAGMNLYESALRVLGKDPRLQARLYFNMGMGYRRWGKKDRAQRCLEASIRLDPAFVKAKTQLSTLTQQGLPPLQKLPTHAAELLEQGHDTEVPGFLDNEGLGLEDFSTSLDQLLGEHAEESLYQRGKKPA